MQRSLHDGSPIEVVLVDNCCTDMTVETAKRLRSKANCQIEFQIVSEPKPGLANARSKGVASARYSTLVFCDDDNWLDAEYSAIAHLLLTEHPTVGLAGGQSKGVLETPPPSWFGPIAGAWAIGEDKSSQYVDGDSPFLRGAGLVVRKQAFQELEKSSFKFLATDRRGASLASGGDSELCIAISELGYRLYYDGRLKLSHWIPSQRLTWNYALRLWQGFGAGTISLDPRQHALKSHSTWKNQVRASVTYQILRSALRLIRLLRFHPLLRKPGCTGSLHYSSNLGRAKALVALGRSYGQQVRLNKEWYARMRSTVCQSAREVMADQVLVYPRDEQSSK